MNEPDPGELWRRTASENNGPRYAEHYAAHFDRLDASGADIHGEADFVSGLVAAGARVLDAGCGTGRIASRLADLGFEAVGVDVDETMIEVARARRPDITWEVADLASMDLGTFDAIVVAGNVIPFVDHSTFPEVTANLRRHLSDGAVLVVGFGLDREHLPPGAPVVAWEVFDTACRVNGLELVDRFGGWGREPASGEYVVSVHSATP